MLGQNRHYGNGNPVLLQPVKERSHPVCVWNRTCQDQLSIRPKQSCRIKTFPHPALVTRLLTQEAWKAGFKERRRLLNDDDVGGQGLLPQTVLAEAEVKRWIWLVEESWRSTETPGFHNGDNARLEFFPKA